MGGGGPPKDALDALYLQICRSEYNVYTKLCMNKGTGSRDKSFQGLKHTIVLSEGTLIFLKFLFNSELLKSKIPTVCLSEIIY